MGHLNKITIYVNTNLYSLKKSHSLTSYPRAQYKEWGDRIGKKTFSPQFPLLFSMVITAELHLLLIACRGGTLTLIFTYTYMYYIIALVGHITPG